MIKRMIFFALVIALTPVFCAAGQNEGSPPARTYADYIDTGAVIGVEAGNVYGDLARDIFKAREAPEYTTTADMLENLLMGRVDALLIPESITRQLKDSGMYPDFEYLMIPEEVYVSKAGPIFHTEELRDKYNEWFAGIAADGTWREIVNRWIGAPLPKQEDIPVFTLTGENGTLKVADTGNFPPLSYFDENGRLAGFNVEMTSRFALHIGMDLHIETMSYEGIAPYVVSGKADMSACTLVITDERREGIIFGEPSVISRMVLVVTNAAEAGHGDIGFDLTYNEPGVTYSDFVGIRIAVKNGSIYDAVASDLMKASGKLLFDDYISVYEAVLHDRADAGMRNYWGAYASLSGSEYKNDLAIFALPEKIHSIEYGAISMEQGTIDAFNAFLASIKADGTYDEMVARWLTGFDPGATDVMPEIPLSGENGVLTAAISSDYMPFSYLGAAGDYIGFDIELAKRFAAYMNKDIEFVDMAFSALLPYVVSGRADIAVSDIAITEERKKSVLFTDPYLKDLSVMIYMRGFGVAEKSGGFIDWLKAGVERNLITDNRWKMIASGLGVTMIIAVLAQLFGTAFGCFICFALTRKNSFVNWLGRFYCGLIHGTPIVVLLMITYYIIFGETHISNVLVAVATFTMVTGANIAENLKRSIETVDLTEIEAARSIGFSAFGAFTAVTLPQAVRRALPGYATGFVELVKATAIVGYIAIQDLTRAGDIVRSRTYDAYFPLLFVAAIYLIITTVCVQLFGMIIKRVNGGAGL